MTEVELAPYRHLWASVLEAAVKHHHRAIRAAKRGSCSIKALDGGESLIGSYEAEVTAARAYFTGYGAVIADRAGMQIRIDRLMAYLTDEAGSQQVSA